MHNMVYLIGRLVEDPQVKELENGKQVANTTVAVQRSYKNEEGQYDVDFVDCTMWNGVASNASEYCRKGDLIGIKGRLQTNNYEVDGEKRKSMEVVCEKISYLAARKEKEQEVEEPEEDLEV